MVAIYATIVKLLGYPRASGGINSRSMPAMERVFPPNPKRQKSVK